MLSHLYAPFPILPHCWPKTSCHDLRRTYMYVCKYISAHACLHVCTSHVSSLCLDRFWITFCLQLCVPNLQHGTVHWLSSSALQYFNCVVLGMSCLHLLSYVDSLTHLTRINFVLNAQLFLKPKLLLHTEHSNNDSHGKKCDLPKAISAVCGSAPFWWTNLVIFGMTLLIIIWTLMPKFQTPIPVPCWVMFASDRHIGSRQRLYFMYACVCSSLGVTVLSLVSAMNIIWHIHCWHSQEPCDGSWTAKIIKLSCLINMNVQTVVYTVWVVRAMWFMNLGFGQ